ncbi:classical arabinogalactan protein 10-like [Magnolia sinica]|uniref:classical arabinogalactan protein 10-like n=1 Tax=Magnolia sinica TaxID=86752 RepID=UPI002659679F|nr:classical arabinogalactan protein 10-like [Magnolia sinica]
MSAETDGQSGFYTDTVGGPTQLWVTRDPCNRYYTEFLVRLILLKNSHSSALYLYFRLSSLQTQTKRTLSLRKEEKMASRSNSFVAILAMLGLLMGFCSGQAPGTAPSAAPRVSPTPAPAVTPPSASPSPSPSAPSPAPKPPVSSPSPSSVVSPPAPPPSSPSPISNPPSANSPPGNSAALPALNRISVAGSAISGVFAALLLF